jgi:UDP-glucose 4-epimerase
VREVIEIARRVSGVEFPVEEAPRRSGDPAMIVARADRICNLLDWEARYNDLEAIVSDAWRWERKLQKR